MKWSRNYREWVIPQRYQSDLLKKAGHLLYLFRSRDQETGYESKFTDLESPERWGDYYLMGVSRGQVDFSPSRRVVGRFNKGVRYHLDQSGKFWTPERDTLAVAYLPLDNTVSFDTGDYLMLLSGDVPYIGQESRLYIMTEVITEGKYEALRATVGLSDVLDESVKDGLESVAIRARQSYMEGG